MIEGKLSCLRALEHSDLLRLVKWRNADDIFPWFFSDIHLAESEQFIWFERYLHAPTERMWIIEPKERHIAIGCLGLVNIDRHHQVAELSRVMVADHDYRNRGICTDAVRTIVAFAFEEMNLNRIYIRTMVSNEAALKLYLAADFKMEGIERQAVWKGGNFKDVAIMAVLRGKR